MTVLRRPVPPLRHISSEALPPSIAALRRSSRSKLRPRDAASLSALSGMPSLWPQVVDTVCSAGVLPRKELFEAWEVAVCVDAAFPAIPLVADLAAGHGLLAWLLLLLGARRGVRRRAVCVDTRLPDAALSLSDAFGERWPELRGQHQYVEGTLDAVSAAPGEALFTSVHACGPLSDRVIERAVASACPVALVPCCHSLRKQPP